MCHLQYEQSTGKCISWNLIVISVHNPILCWRDYNNNRQTDLVFHDKLWSLVKLWDRPNIISVDWIWFPLLQSLADENGMVLNAHCSSACYSAPILCVLEVCVYHTAAVWLWHLLHVPAAALRLTATSGGLALFCQSFPIHLYPVITWHFLSSLALRPQGNKTEVNKQIIPVLFC